MQPFLTNKIIFFKPKKNQRRQEKGECLVEPAVVPPMHSLSPASRAREKKVDLWWNGGSSFGMQDKH